MSTTDGAIQAPMPDIATESELKSIEETLQLESILNSLPEESKKELLEIVQRFTDEGQLATVKLNENGFIETPEKTGHSGIDRMIFSSKLSDIYGLNHPSLGNYFSNQLRRVLIACGECKSQINHVLALISEIAPRDGIEAMLANQMISIHLLAMDSAFTAIHSEQSLEGQKIHLREINKLARTFAAQIEALNRYRGKGQQKVTVEHVKINQGGQAIIGSVETGRNRVANMDGHGGVEK